LISTNARSASAIMWNWPPQLIAEVAIVAGLPR
jgi:hypothetical protein